MSDVKLTPEQYWKFRAEESDRQRLEERAQNALRAIETARQQAFAALGLDSAKAYRFDDAQQSITETEAPKQA